LKFSQQIFEKHSNIKFHENPSCGSRVVPCGQTGVRTSGQMDRRKDEGKHECFAILRTRLKMDHLNKGRF